MKRRLKCFISCLIFFLLILTPTTIMADDEKESDKKNQKVKIPDSVIRISKENTYPNPTQDLPYLQPSDLTSDLLESTDVKIENPDLIRLFNESSISTTPLAIGYRANIYLGQWPLSYESIETTVNWEYEKANVNKYDNRGGKSSQKLRYTQEGKKTVKGGLTAKIGNAEDVKKMMLAKAGEKSGLPLAFETIIGQGTKKEQVYNIAPKKVGQLNAYAPAVNERGKVTFGEVYLQLKGSKKKIVVKNVTQQGIGAWIPVQDHLLFKFITTEQPVD